MPGNLVRVDDGNGNLINLTASEADRYVKANPGASIKTPRGELVALRGRPEPRQDRPADEALQQQVEELTARLARFEAAGMTLPDEPAEPEEAPDFDGMTVPELKAYAQENGIGLEGATLKPDILDAVKAGYAAAQAPAEPEAIEGSTTITTSDASTPASGNVTSAAGGQTPTTANGDSNAGAAGA